MPEKRDANPEETPPVFKSWSQMYWFVLLLHIFIIGLFYALTQHYA